MHPSQSQEKGLSPVCVRTCLASSLGDLQEAPQPAQVHVCIPPEGRGKARWHAERRQRKEKKLETLTAEDKMNQYEKKSCIGKCHSTIFNKSIETLLYKFKVLKKIWKTVRPSEDEGNKGETSTNIEWRQGLLKWRCSCPDLTNARPKE